MKEREEKDRKIIKSVFEKEKSRKTNLLPMPLPPPCKRHYTKTRDQSGLWTPPTTLNSFFYL